MISDTLLDTIKANTPMPFVDFMQQALYASNGGYYSSNLPKLGSQGDFITAPEMTPLFGYTLANQCQQILKLVNHSAIFEFGAGSGQLSVDILKGLEALESLPESYYILDISGNFQQRQKELIETSIPHLASRVQWLTRWPKKPFNGVIIANEVLDAMPVHRFLQTDQGLLESIIQTDEQGLLYETFLPTHNQALINHVKKVLPANYIPYLSEANLFIPGWIQECSNMLNQGAAFMIDYGFPAREYYHPDRNQGTLICHYRHQAHTNPFAHPGEEDITAHVDFTHLAESADAAGFSVAGYTSQASFLLANGILEALGTYTDPKETFIQTQAIKKLLHPEEMGELFKVMALTKGLDCRLQGFELADKRGSL